MTCQSFTTVTGARRDRDVGSVADASVESDKRSKTKRGDSDCMVQVGVSGRLLEPNCCADAWESWSGDRLDFVAETSGCGTAPVT